MEYNFECQKLIMIIKKNTDTKQTNQQTISVFIIVAYRIGNFAVLVLESFFWLLSLPWNVNKQSYNVTESCVKKKEFWNRYISFQVFKEN